MTAAFDSHLRGPSFVMEPPSRLEFSNSSGGWLDCSASGSPQPSIDWLSVDGTSVGDVGGVRRVLRNGTLVLLPFPATAYRQDIHSTIYRCVASNTVGRVISRDVQVRAGKQQSIDDPGSISAERLLYPRARKALGRWESRIASTNTQRQTRSRTQTSGQWYRGKRGWTATKEKGNFSGSARTRSQSHYKRENLVLRDWN
uniref:Ig-like domain-containing protein n=1 Tax=Anopheles culicifacies TaxID=139723 RepID=A0A182MU38_9DIPT